MLMGCREKGRSISSYTLGFDAGYRRRTPVCPFGRQPSGRHHEITITSGEFVDFLPKYVWHMEEPVCEPPAIALYYVSKLASKYVKVLISGEGGDGPLADIPIIENYLAGAHEAVWRLQGAASWGIQVDRGIPRMVKYGPLMTTYPNYYYSRTSSPYQILQWIGELYSTTFTPLVTENPDSR